MSTIELVKRHLTRLKGSYGSDILRTSRTNDTIFPEWVNGKLLLDAKVTEEAAAEQNDGDIMLLLDAIHDILEELGERRLEPALTFDGDGKYVFKLVLRA